MDKHLKGEILLVEDNPTDAELTLRALKRHAVTNKVEWVKDGAAALDYLFRRGDYAMRQGELPRVVLLDLRLPKVEGLEVLRQIRADPLTRMLPVVVMTSSQEEQDVVKSYALNVNSYVAKPVAFDAFAKTVADLGLYWMLINRVPQSPGSAE